MFVADNWKDYEVIDTSCGEKLERWGNYILVRPDPQVIWDTPKNDNRWKHMNGHYHRSSKGGGEWEFFDLPQSWTIKYESPSVDVPLTFNLKPFSFKHTGIFPEQAANWDWFSEKIRNAGRPVGPRQLRAAPAQGPGRRNAQNIVHQGCKQRQRGDQRNRPRGHQRQHQRPQRQAGPGRGVPAGVYRSKKGGQRAVPRHGEHIARRGAHPRDQGGKIAPKGNAHAQ